MLFLFNGTSEQKTKPEVQVCTRESEGRITVFLSIKSNVGTVENIDLFSSTDADLIDVIRSKCSPGAKDNAKLSRRFLSIVGRKILFNYKTKEAASFLSEDKIKGQDKFYGRSIIVLVNPGRVSVCVDKRNFGPISHKFIKDSNVTVSILMPKWSRWWKLKHPVYIETCKFDTRINLLSLSHLEKDGIQSNILKYEDKNTEIPKMEGVVKKEKPAGDKPAFNKDGNVTTTKPYKGKGDMKSSKPYKNDGRKPFNNTRTRGFDKGNR